MTNEHTQIRLPFEVANLVEMDGLSRTCQGDDGRTYVLFRVGLLVHSESAEVWLSTRGELPSNPTEEESRSAIESLRRDAIEKEEKRQKTRDRLEAPLLELIGLPVEDLTSKQMTDLVVVLFRRLRVLDEEGKVQSVSKWEVRE